MMKRIYKYVSTYPTAETVKRKDRITEEELEFLVDEIEYLDLIDMIFLTKFKPYNELSQERFDHLTFIFNRWIESHEWQHYIKWCKKYDIERIESKQWMAKKMMETYLDMEDMFSNVLTDLGSFRGEGENSVRNHFIKRIQESIDNGDSQEQVAFNMLTMISVKQIERIGLDKDYFLDGDELNLDEKLLF